MSSLCLHILNVGHGDSIILELPDNNWGIVDCFKTDTETEPPALTFLKDRNVKKLKFVCLTHPHYDHYRGMLEILKYFNTEDRKIECFWDYGIDRKRLQYYKQEIGSEKEYKELLHLYDFIQERVTKDRKMEYLIVGQKTLCLDLDLIKINAYAPISSDIIKFYEKWGKGNKTINANLFSIVLVIVFGDTNLVLGADTKSWQEILRGWRRDCKNAERKYRFSFVKVSHHGSREGNDKGLWKSYTTRGKCVAVISTGCKYGSPHKETITSIISSKVKSYSTNFRDFKRPTSENYLQKFGNKGFISQSLLEALETVTLPVEAFEIIAPYHGNCSVSFQDNGKYSVSTEYSKPYIS